MAIQRTSTTARIRQTIEISRTRVAGCFWWTLSRHWHSPLSGDGAARAGGRWNAIGMPTLYLSDAHGTAIAEYMQALAHPGTLTPYDVARDSILDLSDSAVRSPAGIDETLLSVDWQRVRDVDKMRPASWHLAHAESGQTSTGCVPSTKTHGLNFVLWR